MKSKYTLTELKAIYLSAEFVEKVKPISKTPIKSIEYLYKGLKKSFEGKYEDLGGSEEDPLNVLSLLERAENGEDAVIALILSNITKTDTVDEVVEYWGDKAIEFHCATSCLLYANLLGMDVSRHDKKFPAARWGCASDVQEMKMMAKMLFAALSMQHPEAYESRISFIDTNTEESELKKLLDESLKHKDYSIYFLIVLICREKGQKIDLVKLKEICADADVESFYYFLANEKIPELEEFNFTRQYNDCLEMNRLAKQVLDNAQREVFVRFMYEYCIKQLNGIMDPMTAYAINTINDRDNYEAKQDDIAVVIQAGHASATKNGNEDLVAALDESYKKIMMGAMFGGGKMPPALDSEVDENRLKQALYFYPEKALTKERIGEKAQIDGKKLYCNFIVENGRKDTELTYDVMFSLEKKFDNCDSLTFTEEEITGSSNMVGGGMIRSISADQTKMEVAGKMHVDNEEYRAFFNVTIDIPYNQVHQFNSVEIIVNEVKEIEDYTVVSVSFIFSPYDEEFSGDEDDGSISFSSRGSLGSFLGSNNEDDYDEEDYEEPLDESDEYADVLDEDEFDYDCTEFDGKCSAYVKFDDGKCYCYNNEDGHISVGDKVTVGGKLAGKIGIVTRLEEYKYDSFMQTIQTNYGSNYEVPVAKHQQTTPKATAITTIKKPVSTDSNTANIYWNALSSMTNCVAMVEFADGKSETYISYGVVSIGDKVYVNGTRVGEIGTVRKLGSYSGVLELSEITSVVEHDNTLKTPTAGKLTVSTSNQVRTPISVKKKKILIGVAIALVIVIIIAIVVGITVSNKNEAEAMARLEIHNLRVESGILKWDDAPDAHEYKITLDGARFDGSYSHYGDAKYATTRDNSKELPFNNGEPYSLTIYSISYSGKTSNIASLDYAPAYYTVTWMNWNGENDNRTEKYQQNKTFDYNRYSYVGKENDSKTLFCQGIFSDAQYKNEVTEDFKLTKNITLYTQWKSTYFKVVDGELRSVKFHGNELVLPNTITSIANNIFKNNYNLKKITLPTTLKSIGNYTFSGCNNLTEINLPDGVESVGEYAFEKCSSLSKITFPNSLKSIGANAFNGCSALTGVYISDIASWCSIDFSSYYNNPLSYAKKLYLNNSLVVDLVIPSGVTKISENAFSGCESIQSVTINSGVKEIGSYAFDGCVELSQLKINNGVEIIGDRAFRDCAKLSGVFIPINVVTMGEYVFDVEGSFTINCEATSKPSGWDYSWDDKNWNRNGYNTVKWGAKNPNTLKTYTFITNGGTSVSPVTDDALYSSPLTTKDGEAFMGWYDNVACLGEKISFPYTGTARTFYAKWETRDGSSFEKAIEIDINSYGSGWHTYTSTKEMYFMFTIPSTYGSLEIFNVSAKNNNYLSYSNPQYTVYYSNQSAMNYTVSAGHYTLYGGGTFYIKVSALVGEEILVSISEY